MWKENAMEHNSQIIIYQTETGETKLEVRLENDTVWLTQKLMAELFQTTVANINIHLKNIFDEGELDPKATIKDFLIVRLEGNRKVIAILNITIWMQSFLWATALNLLLPPVSVSGQQRILRNTL